MLSFLDEESYEADAAVLERVGEAEGVTYGSDAATRAAANDLTDVPAGLDVEVAVAVAVADEADCADRDCDTAFVVGDSRSPTSKAIFGDFAQRVVLNFDGYVTTATR